MRRLLATSIVLVAFATACGSSVQNFAASGGNDPGAPGAPRIGSTYAAQVASSFAPPLEASPVPTTVATTHNTLPLKVTLDRTCYRPGEQVNVIAETVPNASVGFTAYYTDDFTPDIFWYPKDTNPSRIYPWTFTLRPTTPTPTNAKLYVLAARNPRTAVYEGGFLVATSC